MPSRIRGPDVREGGGPSSVEAGTCAAREGHFARLSAEAERACKERSLSPAVRKCRAKFRRYFEQQFYDPTYVDWERDYKWQAHKRWEEVLNRSAFTKLLSEGKFAEDGREGGRRGIPHRTSSSLLRRCQQRDAVKSPPPFQAFAQGLFEIPAPARMTWRRALRSGAPSSANCRDAEPGILTWPRCRTIFGFIAQPKVHFFLKPMVTRRAADELQGSRSNTCPEPNSEAHHSVLTFARSRWRNLRDLRPRDMIDIQSFLWVQGSDEYPD